MSPNPYQNVNLMKFPLRKLVERTDTEVFIFRPGSQSPFEVSVFRDHLARFMLDELTDAKMQSGATGILLEVQKGFDAVRLRENFNAR